ncbi:hypothetical protein MKW98_032247 [Papaver atlanticum]|uniref:Uncharacterized protein n=1 Tax=Papaver atlanticum TaxID=357466 RepID=A0AAD4SEU4_9MAGN|nr:hypothetical protein MKW98_032247 [Papaver atlanticum]
MADFVVKTFLIRSAIALRRIISPCVFFSIIVHFHVWVLLKCSEEQEEKSNCTLENNKTQSNWVRAINHQSRYMVTSFNVVPRGTEGAVSVEGTVAGVLASMHLAFGGCYMDELNNDACG